MVSWCPRNVFKRLFLLRWLQIRERRKMTKVPANGCNRFLTKLQLESFRISPKNTPTATTWWVVFGGLDLYGWDMSTIHATLTPGGDWGDKCKAQLAEPRTEPFLKQQPFAKKNGRRLWDQRKETVWRSKNLLGGEKTICCKEPKKTKVSFLPQDLYYGWRPQKLTLLGKKC